MSCRIPLKMAAIIGFVALVATNNVTAQFNDVQEFNGVGEFAVSIPVPYWSVDGDCSPALVASDTNRGFNGSPCLRTLMPLGVGTRMVKDLNPGPGSTIINEMEYCGFSYVPRLWVSADAGFGAELYKVSGPLYPVMTQEMDCVDQAPILDPADLFRPFPGGWREVFFSAEHDTFGRELWLSNTEKDLLTFNYMYANIHGNSSSNPSEFGTVNNNYSRSMVVFAADDGIHGRELWLTYHHIEPPSSYGDSSYANLLQDINVGGASSDPQHMTTVIFDPGINKNAQAFFTADDGVHGRELWRTDGSSIGGTGLVKDIVAGPTGSNPTNLTEVTTVNNMRQPEIALMFTVNSDGVDGEELWISRGGLGGPDTVIFKDYGAAGSPENLTAVHGRYLTFFTVGNDLYSTCGNDAILPPTKCKTFVSPPTNLVSVRCTKTPTCSESGSFLYFAADDGRGAGTELWRSDGTPYGTVLVKDIRPGPASSNPTHLTEVGGFASWAANTLYFSADDGTNGRELWRNDISAGAVLVKDINPGSASSNPSNLTNYGELYLMFTADDGTHGVELWQSDGYDVPPHNGMSYKWDLSADIQDRTGGDMDAVTGTDDVPLTVFVQFDFPAMGGADDVPSEPAHQVNTYLELTDGTDRAPLDITYVDCGDGNVMRPKAALTDGSNHNAIAFGMVAVLDQDPCDTMDPFMNRQRAFPSVPFAYSPAVYDGHDWIPMTLANFPAGVPTNPGTSQVMGVVYSERYYMVPWPDEDFNTPFEDPWQAKRYGWARIDVWDDYMAVFWGNARTGIIWVATLPRQYNGTFKALHLGNSACIQPAHPFYTDQLKLTGGTFVSGPEHGACCHKDSGICEDVNSASECIGGTYTKWMTCDDPDLSCCPTPWADADNDGDVDQADFGIWQACYTGAGITPPAGCQCFDRNDSTGAEDGDGDIDRDDFAWFNNCLTGPAVLLDEMSPPAGCIP